MLIDFMSQEMLRLIFLLNILKEFQNLNLESKQGKGLKRLTP